MQVVDDEGVGMAASIVHMREIQMRMPERQISMVVRQHVQIRRRPKSERECNAEDGDCRKNSGCYR